MATPILAEQDSWESALKNTWGQYRTWAITSRAYKNDVTRWRNVVLILSIAGAILGTLSQQSNLWSLLKTPQWFPSAFGLISGFALGLAAYFSKEALSPDPEAKAVRARSAAEAFKSEAYLLAADAPPYDTATTTAELTARTDRVREAVANLTHETITSAQESEGMPTERLSVEEYIKRRVDEQIDKFYIPRARENAKKLAIGRYLSLTLGAIAVLFGLLSAKYVSIAGWLAVIGTVTAAIAARQYSGRYQFLVISYQATIERLRSLKTQWAIASKIDAVDAGKRFILGCEETISSENTAWMAEFTKKPE
jgi:hypothetical protein